jgi:hypothetical protein
MLFLLLSLSLLTACGGGANYWVKKIDSPEVTYVVQNYMARMKHDKHLRLEIASCYYSDYINTIRLEFISQDVIEVGEARGLLVDLVEGLLAELNQNPILASQFVTYPFGPRNLEIFINFESFHGYYIDPYYVGWVALDGGWSYFYAFNTRDQDVGFWDYRCEPYYKSREYVVFERQAEERYLDEHAKPTNLQEEQYISPPP